MAPDLNIGSIANLVFNSISPFPVAVSGTLNQIVTNQISFTEQYTGNTIGSVITSNYQLPVTDLSFAEVIRLMAVQDMGVQEMSIGGRELMANNLNLKDMADYYEKRAILALKALTKSIKFYKARG